MSGALGLVLLDETVLGVAIPTIAKDLKLGGNDTHWVINAYLLTFSALVAAGGKLGDIFNIRRLFQLGLVIFGLSSIMCGFAQSGSWLITARSVQGVGAALLFPLSIAIIPKVFSEREHGKAYSLHTAMAGIFLTLGPLIGGAVTEYISWRWIFWINLPLVVAVIVIIERCRFETDDSTSRQPREKFDTIGLVCLLTSSVAIILAIMQGTYWPTYATLPLFALGVAVIYVFYRVEKTRAHPLISISLLRNPTFSAANFIPFVGQFSKLTVVVYGAILMQRELHQSPVFTGLYLLLGILPSLPASLLIGRLSNTASPRFIVCLGLVIALLGHGLLALAGATGTLAWCIAGLVCWGTSNSFCFITPRKVAMGLVTPSQHGQSGGISMTSQMMGGTVAIAVMSALYSLTQSFTLLFAAAAGLVLVTFFVVRRYWKD